MKRKVIVVGNLDDPKEKTPNEVREEFLDCVRAMVVEWDSANTSTRDKLEGLAYSILNIIDGGMMQLPTLILAPNPHPEDKEYYVNNGKDYYPENHNSNIKCNIAGGLHELFYSKPIPYLNKLDGLKPYYESGIDREAVSATTHRNPNTGEIITTSLPDSDGETEDFDEDLDWLSEPWEPSCDDLEEDEDVETIPYDPHDDLWGR